MMATLASEAAKDRELRIWDLSVSADPIPLDIPLGRFAIINLLDRARTADLNDPDPKRLDGGSE